MWFLEHSKESNARALLIVEDDCVFASSFLNVWWGEVMPKFNVDSGSPDVMILGWRKTTTPDPGEPVTHR